MIGEAIMAVDTPAMLTAGPMGGKALTIEFDAFGLFASAVFLLRFFI